MTKELDSSALRDSRLRQILQDYLLAVDAGQAPDPQEWLGRYPDFASELQAFFSDQAQLDQLVKSMRAGAAAGQPGGEGKETLTQATDQASPGGSASGSLRSFGDYEILAEIARGGMGIVYKARQIGPNRLVALKMILSPQLITPAALERFRGEAEAVANLDHPHIVPLYEYGEHEGNSYFSMKLIEGASLAQDLDIYQGDQPEAARLVAVVARAVHYAHQHGILHRDLKPANILLDARGEPHVTDFGLAKRFGRDGGQTQSGAIIGTPSYMAPEQARADKSLSTAADVYSLGAILYELLTGQPPFRAETPLETLVQVVEREPKRPRQRNPKVDRELETVCLKCLEKEPGKRYTSAEALAEDLERWLKSEPIQARPTSVWKRAVKWARRRPAAAGLVAMTLLAVLGLLGLGGALWYNAEARAEAGRELATLQLDLEQKRGELDFAQSKKNELAGQVEGKRAELRSLENKSRWTRYVQAIQFAQAFLDLGQIQRVDELLNDQIPGPGQEDDLRSFEWHYLWRLSHGDRLSFPANVKEDVTCLALSPDGKHLAMAIKPGAQQLGRDSKDYPVIIREVTTGKEVCVCRGVHTEPVLGLAFSSDGKWLTSVNPIKIQVWDARTGVIPAQAETHEGRDGLFTPLVFSPNGSSFVSPGKDKTLRVFSAKTGDCLWTLRGHQLPIKCVAFSSDSRRIASATTDPSGLLGEIKIWNAINGKEIHTWTGLNWGSARCLVFSPDGKSLVGNKLVGNKLVGNKLGAVWVWDTTTGKATINPSWPSGEVTCMAFSPDGKKLVLASKARKKESSEVQVWDARSWKKVLTLRGPTRPVFWLGFSSDGKRLVTMEEHGAVKTWDVDAMVKSKRSQLLPGGKSSPIAGLVTNLAFSSDGQRLSSMRLDGIVDVWDAKTGQELPTDLQIPGHLANLTVSEDGRTYARCRLPEAYLHYWTQKDQGQEDFDKSGEKLFRILADMRTQVEVCDSGTGQQIHRLPGQRGIICRLAFSPEGRYLAAVSLPFTDLAGLRKLWHLGNLAKLEKKSIDEIVQVVSQTLTKLKSEVKVWDLKTCKELYALRGQAGWVTSLTISSDGKQLACASLVVDKKVFNQFGKSLLKSLRFTDWESWMRQWVSLEKNADKTFKAELKTWDLRNGRELSTLPRPGGLPTGLAYSPDGKCLVCASRRPANFPTSETFARLLFSRKTIGESLLAILIQPPTGSADEVQVWDAGSGKELRIFRGALFWWAFSPDSNHFAVAGRDKKRETGVMVWEANTGKEHKYPKLGGWIYTLVFSPDSKRIASAEVDGPIRIWDVATGERLLSLPGHTAPVTHLLFSPDGQRLASADLGGNVRFWDGTPTNRKPGPANSSPKNENR
jgi:WD40 repeat protein